MRVITDDFKNRVFIFNKLVNYGFIKKDNKLIFSQVFYQNFKAYFEFENNSMTSKVVDLESDDEYVLVDIKTSIGRFASEIKKEYECLINDIVNNCSRIDVFKSNQSKEVMEYIENKYNSELEFLWKKFPNNAIYRDNKTNKWFAILVTIELNKINIDSDKKTDVIILKNDNVNKNINNLTVFKGYHMNKKYWITIPLDDRMDNETLFSYVDKSYSLVVN